MGDGLYLCNSSRSSLTSSLSVVGAALQYNSRARNTEIGDMTMWAAISNSLNYLSERRFIVRLIASAVINFESQYAAAISAGADSIIPEACFVNKFTDFWTVHKFAAVIGVWLQLFYLYCVLYSVRKGELPLRCSLLLEEQPVAGKEWTSENSSGNGWTLENILLAAY